MLHCVYVCHSCLSMWGVLLLFMFLSRTLKHMFTMTVNGRNIRYILRKKVRTLIGYHSLVVLLAHWFLFLENGPQNLFVHFDHPKYWIDLELRKRYPSSSAVLTMMFLVLSFSCRFLIDFPLMLPGECLEPSSQHVFFRGSRFRVLQKWRFSQTYVMV